MPETRWIPTTPEVYRAIYTEHHEALAPFGTHTCMDGCYFHGEPHVMTEWGFRDAAYPLIKSELVGERESESARWSYWIACPEAPDA